MANLAFVVVKGNTVVVAVVAEEDSSACLTCFVAEENSLAVEGNLVAYYKGYCLRYPVVVFAEDAFPNQLGVPLGTFFCPCL